MNEATAKLSSIRITPRKMGLLADEIRGKTVNDALIYLQFSPRKKTAMALHTLVKSAAANANYSGMINKDSLFIKTILVGQGTTLKRFRPRAKGSAFRINKKTSHVSVVLAEQS